MHDRSVAEARFCDACNIRYGASSRASSPLKLQARNRDHLALGAYNPHIAVVAAAIDDVASADADPRSLHGSRVFTKTRRNGHELVFDAPRREGNPKHPHTLLGARPTARDQMMAA